MYLFIEDPVIYINVYDEFRGVDNILTLGRQTLRR